MSTGWETAWGLGWSPSGNEIWFSSTRLGLRTLSVRGNLSGKERLLAREPGTLTLQDVAKDGRVLITRDVPRVGMVGMTAGATTRSATFPGSTGLRPRICPLDGKKLLFTESGEAGGENYSTYIRGTDGSPAIRLGDGRVSRSLPIKNGCCRVCPNPRCSSALLPTGAGESQQIDA